MEHARDCTSLPERCDVAIVGAGPAGSTAALLFARAGFDVLLLDRATFPRAKPCGDCLSPQSTHVLDRLGLLDAVLAARPARLDGWKVVSPRGHSLEGRFREFCTDPLTSTAFAISRARLDVVLLDAARSAGAHVRTGVHVTDVVPECATTGMAVLSARADPSSAQIHAHLVVAADGLRSTLARRIRAPVRAARLRKISMTAHMHGVEGIDSIGEMHVSDGLCLGIAPVSGCSRRDGSMRAERGQHNVAYNVTLVADADRFGHSIRTAPASFFAEAFARFASLEGRLDGAVPAVTEPIGPGRDGWLLRSGPFDAPMRRSWLGRVALVGDAAGYFDPFTGQGIHYALTGSQLLVDTVAPALRAGGPLQPALAAYGRTARWRIRESHRLQRIIEFVIGRPHFADHVFAWLARRPLLVHALLATTGDMAPPSSLVRPTLWIRAERNRSQGSYA